MHSNGLRRQPQSETDSLVACKLQGIACKLQGAACKLQGVACELQGAACKLQGAACELQGALANECPKVPPLLYILHPWRPKNDACFCIFYVCKSVSMVDSSISLWS